MIRLSQARAKLELRDRVEKSDALEIVKLVQESVFEACYADLGVRNSGVNNMAGVAQSSGYSQMSMNKSMRGKNANIDPNNVGSLSIPKQTNFYIEKL